jgi:hemerythrin-like domain-containing protein
MFRRVAERVRLDTEAVLNKDIALGDYVGRLSYFGGNLVANLHGHHGWEDRVYFPELSAADPRFETGLEVLEQDHADLDVVLDSFTTSANRAIKLVHLDEAQAREEIAAVRDKAEVIEAFLQRHLGDEEDLAVPIILHHRLRG